MGGDTDLSLRQVAITWYRQTNRKARKEGKKREKQRERENKER
jgi:hypothetical protein